jgi:lipoprotein NlpD
MAYPIQVPIKSMAVAALVVFAAGCSMKPRAPAPVVDRSATSAQAAAQRALPPGAENAGKPGFYTVRPGDTLIRISMDHGYGWRDIQAWNNLDNPDRIVVGQVLRVVPPEGRAVATPVQPRTVPQRSMEEQRTASAPPAAEPQPQQQQQQQQPTRPAPVPGGNVNFIWPANGNIVTTFDANSNKGIGIAGQAGDPVLAAADGRVVYAGSLRGYGNLIVINHNNTIWTAYAHNQALLVNEDQTVRQGQRIADMGNSDSDVVKLHFEVRRQGTPIDPLTQLPRR